MSNLFAVGLPRNKRCIVEGSNAGALDYKDVDLSFVDEHWSGWFARLPDALAETAFDHLTHKITRSPQDLCAHLHRIIAAYHTKHVDTLYGALLDLFIVLDRQGFQLRRRMVTKFASMLTPEQQKALEQGLKPGIGAVDNIPQSYFSRFSKGLVGFGELLEHTDDLAEFEFSILEESRDLIDSGFYEEARMILEEAILQQPDDVAINKELLDLYRYTRNKDAFMDAKKRFQGLNLAMNDEWQELEETLLMDEGVAG